MNKRQARLKRQKRVRAKISGTKERPRVSIFRSNKYIYAQVIDDDKGVTLASGAGKDAQKVGEKVGEGMVKAKIKKAVFDRSGYKYHGNVKKIADVIREKGVDL